MEESVLFSNSQTKRFSNDERSKAILIWPGNDLEAIPNILLPGGSLEKEDTLCERLKKALRQ